MALLAGNNAYWEFLGTCTECGRCREACSSLSCAGFNLGQIAQHMLAAQRASHDETELKAALRADKELTQAVRGCFFCTSCQQTCFAHNDVCKLIYAARVDYQKAGLIPKSAWSSVLVDEEWHIFSAYRAIYGIGYPDLTRHLDSEYGAAQTDCQVAFFPGCSLAAYAPELTREVFATIEELGGKTTMIDHCCGSSLKSAGFYDRATALMDKIAGEIAASGAPQVVCVCPGCANALKAALQRNQVAAEVVSVAKFLLDHQFVPKWDLSGMDLCFSKSCQDRDGSYLDEIRAVLGAADQDFAIYHGCCGAGGAVSAYDYNRQGQQVESKLSFVQDGQTVVTSCPTCTYTYAFQLMSAPRNIANKHYLELLFENQFDWDTVSGQLGSMWTGPYGSWLASVF